MQYVDVKTMVQGKTMSTKQIRDHWVKQGGHKSRINDMIKRARKELGLYRKGSGKHFTGKVKKGGL